jgi:hypothetical protein
MADGQKEGRKMDGNGGRESKRNAEESAGAGDGKNLNMGGRLFMAGA